MEGTGVDRKMILKWILKEEDGEAWTGFVLLRIRSCGRTINNGMPQVTKKICPLVAVYEGTDCRLLRMDTCTI